MFALIVRYHGLLLHGLMTTAALFGLTFAIGIPAGIGLGILGGRTAPSFGKWIDGFRFVTRAVPFLVLLLWLHYPLQSLLGLVVDPFWTALLALLTVEIAGVAQVVKKELLLLPAAYREAGMTLGMAPADIVRRIELPLLVRRISPAIVGSQASILEYTMLASLMSVQELFRVAQTINAMAYRPVEIYSLLVIFFAAILVPIHLLSARIERTYVTYS